MQQQWSELALEVLEFGPANVVRDYRGGPMRTMRGNVAVHNILSGGTNARLVQARPRAYVTWGEISSSGKVEIY